MKVEIIPQSVYSESHIESYEMVKQLGAMSQIKYD